MSSRRKTKKKPQRNWFAITVVSLLLVIVALAIAVTGYLLMNRKTFADLVNGNVAMPGTPAAQQQREEAAAFGKDTEDAKSEEEAPTPTPEEEIPEEERYYFSDNQMYKGDLILVNSEYPFHFDANEDLDVKGIREVNVVQCAMAQEDFKVCYHIMSSLRVMIEDCNEAVGAEDTGISSAYRTLDYQQRVYNETETEMGKEYADKYVATPGYSEHHTGLAVDLGIYRFDGYVGTFSESNNAVWVNNNSQRYGFVRRYREDKVSITGISNEAWHFRYVGVPHATYMTDHNLCLEEYIDFLRTRTEEVPLNVVCNNGMYKIWYTQEEYIREPEGPFTVSGNNIDGYIITETVIS